MDLLLGDILYEGSSRSSDDDSANESFNVGEMVDRDFEGIHENNMPDPFKHLSSLYFSFDRKAYGLMVRDLKGEISVSLEMLKACDVRGMLDLKKWRRMKDTFGLAGVDNGSTCIVQQTQPKLQIACIEDWGNIVKTAHCVRGASKHKSLNDTIEMLRSTWSIDVKRHGIPISYVKDFVNSCRCSFSSSNHTIDLNKLPMTTLITTEEGVAVELENIMIEHKTRIVMARLSKKESATKHVIHYVCHRGGTVQHCSKEKRSRTSKKCGCPFKVRLEYVNHRDAVRILINPNHEGHMPGSRADLYHLPVHPTVVESCLNDLFDVGSSRYVAQMSLSKERLLFERAPLLHRVIYRFFMIPKEVQMLSYKTRTADQIHDDDWATIYMEAKVLQNQGKVPKEMREDVYSMCNIMHSVTEEEFEDRFQLLRQRYSSYADSGCYGVPGNSKEHRARLLAGERILQRFEENQDTLQVLNAMQLQFRILSMTTPNQWYQVNFQSNYCDCSDWSSECKHLYGVKLIVKHHFLEMATILPVLDNAHQTLATYDNEIVTEEKEEKVKTCIHELKELLLSLEQEIPNKSPKDMEIMLHQLRLSKDMLGALLSPSQIDMPACGSVRQIQAHVTRTRLGHGVPKDVGAPPLEAAPKPIPHTGSLKRKHQRGQSHVQFAKWPRIWCPHCCSKTLLVDPKEVVACQTCHALLPLSLRHCHPRDEMFLLGKEIMAFLESGSWHARIDSCAYAHGTNDERSFKIKPSYENTMQIVFASKLRMVLVY
ncbi:hypothetical protein L7F22_020482 [Adiantum nelumboides]|nr:hypothetical protein [Adiantum nelumboides]